MDQKIFEKIPGFAHLLCAKPGIFGLITMGCEPIVISLVEGLLTYFKHQDSFNYFEKSNRLFAFEYANSQPSRQTFVSLSQ